MEMHLKINVENTLDLKGNWIIGGSTVIFRYESFSDVGEIRVWFASKILTPCRMH